MACPSRGQLEALAHGSADPDQARELSGHLEECAACREKLETLRRRAVPMPECQSASATTALATGDQRVDGSAQPTLATPPDLEIDFSSPAATSFPGYEIVKELHRGGQGIVYQAIQRSTKRKVAIKVVKEGPFASHTERTRFEREVAILGQFQHPNIVTIHDRGDAAGHDYYVMDYIPGQSLDGWLSCAGLREKLLLFCKIVEAVGEAHRRGITHRDLKPGNIRVDDNNEPHILDFGLAKTTGALDASAMTQTGQFMGTLFWASPEQAEGVPGKIDIRTDVYSLGVLMYQGLTGQFPYSVVGNMRDVLGRIMNAEPQRPSVLCGQIDRDLETIVLKCLQKQRERRYQTAGELANDLRRYLAGQPIQARPDSLSYMVWRRARRALRRQSLAAIVGALALIMAISQVTFVPLVYRWTPAQRYYERALAAIAASCPGSEFEHVRVIALTDRTDIAALAAAAGLTNVSADNLRSLRRMHGALMERLAASGLQALAWDITFTTPSEFDDDLLRGMRAIRAQGADVVLSVKGWHLSESELPAFSPAILREFKWAATTGDFAGDRPWSLDLVVEHPGSPPAACLALTTANAAFRPGTQIHVEVDRLTDRLISHCWNPVATAAPVYGVRAQLTSFMALPDDKLELGLRRDDVIGQYYVTIPPDEVLECCTLEYQDVFLAGQEQLRRWLGQRVVLVGDLRSGVDRHPCPGGRTMAGAYGQASAIEAIMHNAAVRAPTEAQGRIIIGLAVVAGAAAGLLLHRSPLKLTVLLVVLLAAAGVAAVAAYRELGCMFNPLVPMLALLFSGPLMAYIRRHALAGQGLTQTQETSL